MPRQAKKVPRPCPGGCGHMIRQPYYKKCTWCRRSEKRLRREQRKLRRELMRVLNG